MGLPSDLKSVLDEWFLQMKEVMMEKLESICKKLEEKVERLEVENQRLKAKVDGMERYERSHCLELHNIPVSESENPVEIVKKVAAKMNIKLADSDIDTAYRINNKKKNTVPRLYVKFVRRSVKNLIYDNKSKSKVTHQHLELSSTGKVYIHESLPKQVADLYYLARDRVKEASYKYIWTKNLQIFVRYNETSKPLSIKNIDDLNKITSVRNLRSTSKSIY